MLTHEQNMRLCRVEGDAPMGAYMRRAWIPVAMIEEVAEPDGAPLPVRVFGENLVLFRDTEGRLGLLEDRCAHRKASLSYGRNEEGGLRCLYHGWKFAHDGEVLEMPTEPPAACAASRFRQKSYPVEEAGGFVWSYLGDPATMPAFEPPAFAPTPEHRVAIGKCMVPCNWAQILEGQIDSAHSSHLHSSDMVPARVGRAGGGAQTWTRPSTDKAPRLQVQLTNYGFRYAAIRRPIANANTHDYIRVTTFVSPLLCLIPPNASHGVAQITVPIDDTHSWFYFMAFGDGPGVPSVEAWRRFLALTPGLDVDANWHKTRTQGNRFGQDRQAMALGNFTGIRGIPAQDMAMWETMGPIADRTTERLGASDIAIVQWRRLMLDALDAFEAGAPPLGRVEPRVPQAEIASFEGVVPKTVDWRTLGVAEREATIGRLAVAAE